MRGGPVHEEQLFGGAGKGGVEPMDIIRREHIIRHIPLVEIDMCPLSTLRLMTGHCVGVFDL